MVFRLRCVPGFGKETIRGFTGDASRMRKIAAHDYEDILQVWVLPFIAGMLQEASLTQYFPVHSAYTEWAFTSRTQFADPGSCICDGMLARLRKAQTPHGRYTVILRTGNRRLGSPPPRVRRLLQQYQNH